MTSARRAPICLALASVSLLLAPGAARAHDESVSASDVRIDERQVLWKVDVGLAGLAKVIDFPQNPQRVPHLPRSFAPNPGPPRPSAGVGWSKLGGSARDFPRSPAAGELAALDEAEVLSRRDEIGAYLARGLQVFLDGDETKATLGRLEPRREALTPGGPLQITRVALELRFASADPIEQVRARLGLFSDLTSTHRAVMKIRWGDEDTQMARLGVSEVLLERGRLNPGRWTVAWDFLRWGAHHIFIGYDHIAFLLALLLAVGRLRSLLFIITSFTVAHSLTILLAALEVVRMPVRVTEALIAASIVWVALENLVLGDRPRPRRWLLTFAFGLVHGLGFAEVLRERLAEAPGGVLLPVIAFNLGVELGQAVLVSLAFPLLIWLRRGAGGLLPPEAARTRSERILRLGSIPIALLGLFWLAQRLL